ncbi:chromosome-associated kinesin KIF4A-like [Haemaphysalis longicornis]
MELGKTIPVRVAVRCRPLVTKELIEGCQVRTRALPNEQTIVLGSDKAFKFDYVFDEETRQTSVYDTCVSGLIPKLFEGFNVTILAYGQTGSGKTFTMGTACSSSSAASEEVGIIPRAVQDIFQRIAQARDKVFRVRASFLEIYKEDVFDLFSRSQEREALAIREDTGGAIKIPNLTELAVTACDETIRLLEVGSASRSTASTEMNLRSSRSHAIFTLTVEQQDQGSAAAATVAKFHLVDLAGSERAGKTKAVGERLREGININRGLLSLGNVISALCDGSSHVPYRDSKLTRLLKDSLGGNSHTVMIACVSPADSNLEETLNTLRYADRARKIKNKPVVNIDPTQAEVAQLRQQLQEALMQLKKCGAAQGDSGEESSSLSGDDMTRKELSLVLSRSAELESENQRLTGELHGALDRLGELSERLVVKTLELEKLNQVVAQVQLKIESSTLADANGDHAAVLLHDLQTSIMEFSASEEKRRKQHESLFRVDQEMPTIEEEGDEGATSSARCVWTDATMRRAALSKELEELSQVLQAKEKLASKISGNDSHLEVIKNQCQVTTQELEREVAALKRERDELSATILAAQKDSKGSSGSKKAAEQRRTRIQELEERVAQLRKQLREQSRIISLKEDAERSAKKLQEEIVGLRQARVQLMRRLKEESERHRRAQTERDREVWELRQRERQQEAQMARAERLSAQRIQVMQRRMEEALAAKNRLEAAARRRQENRALATNIDGLASRTRCWLEEELTIVCGSKKAEHHLHSVIEDRKAVAVKVHDLNKQLQEGDVAEEEKADALARLQELQRLLQDRNEKIAELQQHILDVEADKRIKRFASHVNDLFEAKIVASCSFKKSVEKDLEAYLAASKLEENARALAEQQALVEELQGKVQRTERAYQLQLAQAETRYQEEKLCLLKHTAHGAMLNPDLDNSVLKQLQKEVQNISQLQVVHDELRRKTEEVESLERELACAAMAGRKPFFPDLSSRKPRTKPKKGKGSQEPIPCFAELQSSSEDETDVASSETDSEVGEESTRKRKSKDEEGSQPKKASSRLVLPPSYPAHRARHFTYRFYIFPLSLSFSLSSSLFLCSFVVSGRTSADCSISNLKAN